MGGIRSGCQGACIPAETKSQKEKIYEIQEITGDCDKPGGLRQIISAFLPKGTY